MTKRTNYTEPYLPPFRPTPHWESNTEDHCWRCGGAGFFPYAVKGPYNQPGACFRCGGSGVEPSYEVTGISGYNIDLALGHQLGVIEQRRS